MVEVFALDEKFMLRLGNAENFCPQFKAGVVWLCHRHYFSLKKSNKITFADVRQKIKPSSKAQAKPALTTGDFFALKAAVEMVGFFFSFFRWGKCQARASALA